MPDNTNVNNNSAVTVVGRTAPVPPGQQTSDKSIPVVIAVDQSTIPVEEQNKVQSEVALSLLGIPRSEVALGIFADVNTYDVNPSEWTSTPEQFATVGNDGNYVGVAQTMGWGLTHVPEESGALLEAPADKTAILTSKRFFRYQPGRVSSATFGVKTTLIASNGAGIYNPCVRKYGIFDNYDGYYWESRNNGEGDNFCVVRRTQSITFKNPVEFSNTANPGQTSDYGVTNPYDPLEPRGSESVGAGETSVPSGYSNSKLGDLVIVRDNLMMTHAAVYDESLLQPRYEVGISSIYNGNTISLTGLAKSITNAVYNIENGLMTVTTSGEHGFKNGKYITLTGIAMTCDVGSFTNEQKIYPNRTHGYNIVRVDSPTSFTVNVGVSTVPTYYQSGGHAVGLSTGQYVSYSKGTSSAVITNLVDDQIYKVTSVAVDTSNSNTAITLNTLNNNTVTGLPNVNGYAGISSHVLVTPVPFIQPVLGTLVNGDRTAYTTVKPTGMFPYMYFDADGNDEGYIDTTLPVGNTSDLKTQIDQLNAYYDKWVNQNVDIQYFGVYEYRVPRSRFSGDRLDGDTDRLLYSDVVSDKRAGQVVTDADTGEQLTDTGIWDLDLTKVTMYKVEFSWYGAVGALFLAYVPVSNGEARWVRVHHLRASNQLKVSSLGNATLPITYLIYGGGGPNREGYANSLRTQTEFGYGSSSEHIVKYGASYYIDGGDRGTVKLFSYGSPTSTNVYGLRRTYGVGTGSTQVSLNSATDSSDPYMTAGATSGLSSSYYVGARVITSNPLDQNIKINYYNPQNDRLHLNAPLSSSSISTIDIIPERVTPLIGIKCRDFIQSSTGRSVRNRTQVYPTRLSTGSTGVIKLDLLKTPIFQTDAVIVEPNDGIPSLTSSVNIGKRGKPTRVELPLVVYTGNHNFSSGTAGAISIQTGAAAGGTLTATTGTDYDGSSGVLTVVTTTTHGMTTGDTVAIANGAITLTCSLDNYATTHSYPRSTDPTSGQNLTVTVTNTTTFTVNVGQAQAEYIRDIGTGTYGYFRGYFESDASQRPISVLGYLENRGSDRTKGIETDGYYFYALESTLDNIILTTAEPFLREENSTPIGEGTSSTTSEFTLDQLSSVKVNPQTRSPIPGTGTIVASIFVPASGEEYDLSPYFDYNKEYLSFPLTNKVESLYLCGSSQSSYNPSSPSAEISASLTWEEQ